MFDVYLPHDLYTALHRTPLAPTLRGTLARAGLPAAVAGFGAAGLGWGALAPAAQLGGVWVPGSLGWALALASAAALAAATGVSFALALLALPLHRVVWGRQRREAKPGEVPWLDARRERRWSDADGRLTRRTHLGRMEGPLAQALADEGFYLAAVARPGLPTVVPQYELVGLGRGDRNFVADFAYIDPSHRLYLDVEVDEAAHHSFEKDRARNLAFLKRGWVVVRVPEAAIATDARAVAREVRRLVTAFEHDDLATIRAMERSAALFGPPA
ncbi:MAG: hypothetical protein VKS61_03825 [Candidatus Sericytochromatia bacterium]|nr:hypothetical protein [Candidatus Sericytochromatia bacterium]